MRKEIEEIRMQKFAVTQEKDEISLQISQCESEIESLQAQTIKFPDETVLLRDYIQKEFENAGIDSSITVETL